MKQSMWRMCATLIKRCFLGGLKAAVIAVTIGSVGAVRAADGTWTNTASGGLWSTIGNWSSGTVATGNGFAADFSSIDIAATNTVRLDSARNLGNLTFGDTDTGTAGGWTLNNNGNPANILTLAGTTPTITVNALGGAMAATVSATLAGTAGLTKSGPGTLTLTTNNTYTGSTLISGGTLQLSPTLINYPTPLASTNITVENGGTLAVTGGANLGINVANNCLLHVKNGGTLQLDKTLTAKYGKFDTGASVSGSGLLYFNTTNSATRHLLTLGSVNFPGGAVVLRPDNAANPTQTLQFDGTGMGATFSLLYFQVGVNAASTGIHNYIMDITDSPAATNDLTVTTLSAAGDATATRIFTKQGTGALLVSNAVASNPGNFDMKVNAGTMIFGNTANFKSLTVGTSGTLQLGNNGTAGSTTASITNNGTLAFNRSNAYTYNGVISGSGAVIKQGAGNLTLAKANTFTGPVTVIGGTLALQSAPALGSAVWLDASVLSSLDQASGGTGGVPAQGDGVGRWTSLSGDNWVSSVSKPTYQTNVLGGLPVLRFTGQSLAFNNNVAAQGSTVFIVYRVAVSVAGGYANPITSSGQTPTEGWLHMINNSTNRCLTKGGGSIAVNSPVSATNWAVQVMQLQAGDYRLWVDSAAYGPHTSTTNFTPFTSVGQITGDFGEILIYTNQLSSAERQKTTSYLGKKWLGINVDSAVTNSFSPVIAAAVSVGAVLDLSGSSQMLAALGGSGQVNDGFLTVTGRLAPGDTDTAAGVLSVNGDLTLAAGVTNAFDYVAAAPDRVDVTGTLTLQGANLVALSLGGQKPPAQMTLFTFSTLAGEEYLASWTVQGAGLGPYKTQVKRVGNSLVLTATPLGTLTTIR